MQDRNVAKSEPHVERPLDDPPTRRLNDVPDDAPGSMRVTLLYLDEDPEQVTKEIDGRTAQWDDEGRGAPAPQAEETSFASPVRTIIPWQDW